MFSANLSQGILPASFETRGLKTADTIIVSTPFDDESGNDADPS
jgi:hypothetical protein